MKCLMERHKAKTTNDLLKITSDAAPIQEVECTSDKPNGRSCKEKAAELLTRINKKWNPNWETPHRHNLWYTPERTKKYKGLDPKSAPVLYNPNTRSEHSLLGGIQIFGKSLGHKSKKIDPFRPETEPPRIDEGINPSGRTVTISTDGSAVRNGWENASAGIGVWYNNGDQRNIRMKLQCTETNMPSNSRAELRAILKALKQNESDDLAIESDSLTSLRAICN